MEKPVDELIATIREEYRPEKIILFGSSVWGEPDEESDLDLLIIKESQKREVERIRDVYRLVERFQRRPYRLPLDILVKTPAEVRDRLAAGDDFLRRIIEEGRVVFEEVSV